MRRGYPNQTPFGGSKASNLHRDGFSCETPAAFNFDANGHGRWCVDCGAELGEQAYHEDGADVGPRLLGLLLIVGALVVLGVVIVLAGLRQNQERPVRHEAPPASTPVSLWHPDAEWTGVPFDTVSTPGFAAGGRVGR